MPNEPSEKKSASHQGEPPPTDWVGRAVRARVSPLTGLVAVAAGLAVSWLATYLLGGAGHVAPHWFYIPILASAARFGLPGALTTALASGILAGPLMPLDVSAGTAQDLSDWTSRAGFFLGNGLIMAAVIGRLRRALSRELAVATMERDLARHKEQVIQTVSHEFRTPLTVLRGTCDTLAQRDLVAPEARDLLASQVRAIQRLDNLVRLVLATSQALIDRRQAEDVPVDLRELVTSAAGPERATRIRSEAEPGAETITGDPELLGVLFHAVIDNALKFSSSASPVAVSARPVQGAIEVRVRDDGPGIDPGYLERAFEAFTQQDQSDSRPAEGLGVGLFAATKICDLIGGQIALHPADGGGTEAIIIFPQRRAADLARAARRARLPA